MKSIKAFLKMELKLLSNVPRLEILRALIKSSMRSEFYAKLTIEALWDCLVVVLS